ncbi:Aste57867_2309 [Aphanomyces stellatus]|uniref:Aste57867_2309 protein n=1 Tax=Aphanomyces stellatus TaxID=120398 RepID=A0A485K790_9STRA|nr:hypothetical protein As57867_002304 [Aphanomyces stellatus]VFT79511.1 Aste57867_2309 [Aphanomyces stellatus]
MCDHRTFSLINLGQLKLQIGFVLTMSCQPSLCPFSHLQQPRPKDDSLSIWPFTKIPFKLGLLSSYFNQSTAFDSSVRSAELPIRAGTDRETWSDCRYARWCGYRSSSTIVNGGASSSMSNVNGNMDGMPGTDRPEYVNTAPVELGVAIGCGLGTVIALVFVIVYVLVKVWQFESARARRLLEDPLTTASDTLPYIFHALDVNGGPPMLLPFTFRPSLVQEYRMSVPLDYQELEDFRLDVELLQRTQRLATGGFGSVWLGTYKNEPVAIKTMVEGRLRTSGSIQQFIDEVKLMAKLDHPNVVRFVGACWQSLDAVNLVVEYMDMGDLKDQLDQDPRESFPWVRKVHCATDILRALVYLHDQNIIHRDLKSRNVLMDSHKPCKLSDFGISRELVSRTMSHEVGTFLWAAPEVLKGGKLTVAADIYSFGASFENI